MRFHHIFWAWLLLWLVVACGRDKDSPPEPAKPIPRTQTVQPILRFEDSEVRGDGQVCNRKTGQPFTGLMREFWPNGKLKREHTLVNGMSEGPARALYADGRKQWEGHIVQGKLKGTLVEWSEDGLIRTESVFEKGRSVSKTKHGTARLKSKLAVLWAERDQMDKTVWRPEVESQEREKTFVKLWDDLREASHDWKPLEQFAFQSLQMGELGDVSFHDWGIERREMGKSSIALDHADWLEMIGKWRDKSIRLVETEWHQASYEPGMKGKPSKSVFRVVAHVVDEPGQTRHILRGTLRVTWSSKKAPDGLYEAEKIVIEGLTVLSRKGEVPFVTEKVINVSRDNPAVNRVQSGGGLDLFARVDPPTLVLQDLNGDHLPEVISGRGNLIYWNRGNFKLEPEVLLKDAGGFKHAIVFADFTGDGHLDLFTFNPFGIPEVIPGDGKGKFTPIKLESPLQNSDQIINIRCSAVGDIDGDGDLDIYATQYKPAYERGVMPEPYYDANDGHPAYLLLNDGTGRFADGTEAAGLEKKRNRRTYSASFVDLDNDHDLDLLVVSDFAGMDLYYNDGKGNFVDRTDQLGEHRFSFGMSHSLADFDGDGNLDIYMLGMGSTTARRLEGMNLGRPGFESIQDARMKMGYGNRLFLGDGKGGYKQAPYNDRVARSGWSWGCTPWDFDNDGDRDLFVANGHLSGKSCRDYCTAFWRQDIYQDARVENPVTSILFQDSMKGLRGLDTSWNGYEHNVLFMNEGNGSYRNVAFLMGVSHESDCRSVVSGDLDHDGRPDLLVVEGRKRGNDKQREGYIQVIRNKLENGNHWVGVHLEGQPIGAVVSVFQGGKRQFLPIVTGDSFNAQHATTVHFGLGKTESIDVLEVRWPNGRTTRVARPAIDRYHVIRP